MLLRSHDGARMKNTGIPEVILWAEEYLLSHGYTIKNSPEDIQITPWSSVKRFFTSDGYVYLKQTPPALSLEPIISQILREKYDANVPQIIATNIELNCFLMKDAGITLREYFKNNFQPVLLCQAIKQYTAIQCATSKDIDKFLNLGVPDWRLGSLPALYTKLLSNEKILIEDGITTDEINLLHKLHHTFSSLCELLSKYKIPETLDHCDFHDNNILIEVVSKNMIISDLGETVITHPFFSLITCLRNATFRYSIKETDKTYLELKEACFEIWLRFEKKDNLLDSFSLAQQLWPIYESLGQYRLMISSNPVKFKSLNRRGRLIRGLKAFISFFTV